MIQIILLKNIVEITIMGLIKLLCKVPWQLVNAKLDRTAKEKLTLLQFLKPSVLGGNLSHVDFGIKMKNSLF